MSHPSPAEIHDHVYGFRRSTHVEACPECRRALEAVEAERDALKDALAGERAEAPYEMVVKLTTPRKPRSLASAPRAAVSISGLAAGLAFLAGLSWMLFYKPPTTPPVTPADSGNVTRKDDIDRLIGHLKDSNPLRREMAATALKAYGGAAVEKLENARAAPALVDACRMPALSPVRVPSRINVSPWAEAFESPLKEKHDEGSAVLRDLGFAAEPVLWGFLDSPDTGVRERAAELLRRLYTPGLDTLADPLEFKLRSTEITLDLQDASLAELLGFIAGTAGISFGIDTQTVGNADEVRISLAVKDLAVDNTLRLVLESRGLTSAVVGDLVLITKPGRTLRTPRGPTWLEAATARKMEHLIDALASADAGKHAKAAGELEEMGEDALGPLLQACRLLDPDAAVRCSDVRRRIAAARGAWLVDEPFGADVRRLTTAQKDLLNRKITLKPAGKSLDETLRDLNVPFERRAPCPWKVAFVAKDLRLAWFLRAATRPYGLDFCFRGDTLVIDTAARVAEAVEK
jgi:hypothetical protein